MNDGVQKRLTEVLELLLGEKTFPNKTANLTKTGSEGHSSQIDYVFKISVNGTPSEDVDSSYKLTVIKAIETGYLLSVKFELVGE